MKFTFVWSVNSMLCAMAILFLSLALAQPTSAAEAIISEDVKLGVNNPNSNQTAAVADNNINFDDYLIGPSNLLDIKVTQDPNLSRTLRVDARGEITLPLLGVLHAEGLTPKELEQKIAMGLQKNYIKNPDVIVFVREYTNLKINIQGQVSRPGIYNMLGKPTLLESISMAGGLTEKANAASIKIVRAQSNKSEQTNVVTDIYDYEAIKSATVSDPAVANGDIIFVNEAVPIIVEGAVLKPGVIYPKPNSTLLQIISLAGGLRELGDSTKILVYSPETKTGRDSRVFNIERIREGKDPDPQLIAGNVVVVEESGSRALMYGIGRFARSIFSFGAMQNPMQ